MQLRKPPSGGFFYGRPAEGDSTLVALTHLARPARKISYAISYKQWLAKRPKKAPQLAVAALRR